MPQRIPHGGPPPGGPRATDKVELRHPTDRYKCASNAHALHRPQALYPQCQSVLIFPLDQAIHSLVRCKILENVPQGGGFSTEKSEITLSNGQMHVHKQRTCIVWVTSTPLMVSKRAHLSVRSSKWLTCPLENVKFSNGKVRKLRNPTDRYKCASNAHALYGSQACHPQCQSVLIFPLDQAIHSLVRCKTPN